jgi:hypothetical protein
MKKLLLAVSMLTALALPASANMIFIDQEDLGGLGFGAFPRMLTLQTATFEFGSVTPVDVVHDGAIPGADKSTTPTLAALAWASGAEARIAFNADTANTGITIDTLVMTVYNGTAVVGSFSLGAPVTFSLPQVQAEQGNGNGVFVFGLDPLQQNAFSQILAMPGSSGFTVGLNSSLGCGAGAPAGCIGTNDGPDTYFGITGSADPVPGPVAGAGLPGAVFGSLGLMWFARRRQQRAQSI